MSWIRRETEKGAVQYICPHCHDYHEFREDFGGRTFSENYIFCRRCGARNGTGNAPTLTPQNEPEYREYTCPNCHHTWLEDRDASDYPEYCPGCGDPLHKEENEPLTCKGDENGEQ